MYTAAGRLRHANHYNRLYDDKGEPMVEELTVIVLTGIESLLLVSGYGGV